MDKDDKLLMHLDGLLQLQEERGQEAVDARLNFLGAESWDHWHDEDQ